MAMSKLRKVAAGTVLFFSLMAGGCAEKPAISQYSSDETIAAQNDTTTSAGKKAFFASIALGVAGFGVMKATGEKKIKLHLDVSGRVPD